MKFKTTISDIRRINELPSYWTPEDYRKLLSAFDYPDAEEVKPEELKEMLDLVITDFEPSEAAAILLEYKLGDQLSKGQITALSHEMQEDKVAEEYPEPELHYDLFNINQLLYKTYNGTFPNTEASVISIDCRSENKVEMTEEIMTKIFSQCLSETSILKRLYADQLAGKVPFDDAAKFIWVLTPTGEHSYELITSKYWVEKEDIVQWEYEATFQDKIS